MTSTIALIEQKIDYYWTASGDEAKNIRAQIRTELTTLLQRVEELERLFVVLTDKGTFATLQTLSKRCEKAEAALERARWNAEENERETIEALRKYNHECNRHDLTRKDASGWQKKALDLAEQLADLRAARNAMGEQKT